MNFPKELIIGVAVIGILALGGWVSLSGSAQPAAPQVSMTTLDGNTISTQDLSGNPTLITFWATDCPGCIKEMPHLVELESHLGDQGLEIIGIAMAHDRPDYVLAMREGKGLNYDIVLDTDGQLAQAFGNVRLTPTTILLNPQGKMVFRQLGEVDFTQLESDIKQMLQQPA